jgi:hypothetical protein
MESVLGSLVGLQSRPRRNRIGWDQRRRRPHQAEKACRLQMGKRLVEDEAAKWAARRASAAPGAFTASAPGRRVVVMKRQQTSSNTAYESAELFALAEAVHAVRCPCPGLDPPIALVRARKRPARQGPSSFPMRRPETVRGVFIRRAALPEEHSRPAAQTAGKRRCKPLKKRDSGRRMLWPPKAGIHKIWSPRSRGPREIPLVAAIAAT